MTFPATLNPKFSLRWYSQLPKSCFSMELTCHLGAEDACTGPFRWCLYAYIYPSHPLYAQLEAEARTIRGRKVPIWSAPCLSLPFHKGCSYAKKFNEDGHPYWKLGGDYSHLYDEHFTQVSPEILQSHSLLPKGSQDFAELPDYSDFLRDAQLLYEVLERMATEVTEGMEAPAVTSSEASISTSDSSPSPPTTEAGVLGGRAANLV